MANGTCQTWTCDSEAKNEINRLLTQQTFNDLVRFAAWRIGFRRDLFPNARMVAQGGMSPEDFVNAAIERVIRNDGFYRWNRTRNSDMILYLKVVIRGLIASHFRNKSIAVTDCVDDHFLLDNYKPISGVDLSNPREQISQREDTQEAIEFIDRISSEFEQTNLVREILTLYLLGVTKPRTIGKTLNISSIAVQQIRNRIRTYLRRKGIAPLC